MGVLIRRGLLQCRTCSISWSGCSYTVCPFNEKLYQFCMHIILQYKLYVVFYILSVVVHYMLFRKIYVNFNICNLYLNKSDLEVLPEINAICLVWAVSHSALQQDPIWLNAGSWKKSYFFRPEIANCINHAPKVLFCQDIILIVSHVNSESFDLLVLKYFDLLSIMVII